LGGKEMDKILSEEEINQIVLSFLDDLKNSIAKEAADDAAEAETYAIKAELSAKRIGSASAYANARYASSAAISAQDAAENAVRSQKNDVESAAGAVFYAGFHRNKAAEQLRMAKFFYENVEATCSN
jgi:hypothetical protein